jgi:hypothetical protein
MLIRAADLDAIRRGDVTLAFRRWKRPTVRSGGTLLTAAGQLEIVSVSRVEEGDIGEDDARRAGHASRASLLAELNRRPAGELYRIELGRLDPDTRIRLRESVPDAAGVAGVRARLERMDRAAEGGPWTGAVLRLLAEKPGVRAGDLASRVGMERLPFKARVRKLKALGLTISLGTGYRLSPRGEAVQAAIEHRPAANR